MASPSKTKTMEGTRVTVNFSDSIDLIDDQIQWSPKGVSLLTKWPFAEGTEVEFAFDHRGERHCCTGVVVSCHALQRPAGHFEVVLYFVETPCSKLQKAACACRLARAEKIPKTDTRHVNRLNGVANFASHTHGRRPE